MMADMFALVVFSFVLGMIIEIVISGLSFQQSLSSRLLSIPVNLIIAYPYGIYRDFIIKTGFRIFYHKHMKYFYDLIAYVTYQSPAYAMILFMVGATFEQIITAVISNLLIFSFMGVFYGMFLDKCRIWFKVPKYINITPV
jgi:hypothetical protein